MAVKVELALMCDAVGPDAELFLAELEGRPVDVDRSQFPAVTVALEVEDAEDAERRFAEIAAEVAPDWPTMFRLFDVEGLGDVLGGLEGEGDTGR